MNSKAVNDYRILGFRCEESGNLYALVMERCSDLARKIGRQGYIVPVSSVSTNRYATLQGLLAERDHFFSCYDDRPSRLFEGLEHSRLTIHITGEVSRPLKRFSTRYNKWLSEERQTLFENLQISLTTPQLVDGTLPKQSSEVEHIIIKKLASQQKQLSLFFVHGEQNPVFYSRKVGYFLQVLNFEPRVFDRERPETSPLGV